MIIAQVVGSAVATIKHDLLKTTKMLIVRQADTTGKVIGDPFLAIDLVGAGEGELVAVSQGSSARVASGSNQSPVDAAIVGILDSLRSDGALSYRKG